MASSQDSPTMAIAIDLGNISSGVAWAVGNNEPKFVTGWETRSGSLSTDVKVPSALYYGGPNKRDNPQWGFKVTSQSEVLTWRMDTPADNVISQGPHATALCRDHEQKPDKKRNALSAGGFIPVATNYNRFVLKTLSTDKQKVVGLIQRHQTPSISEFRNETFDSQESQHNQYNDGTGGSTWEAGNDRSTGKADNGGSTGEAGNGNTGGEWGSNDPSIEGW
ncbi:actin-like ATPase domain protein [Fusarium sp. NRRL 52700]|nr:actin-like ATPase domain protein [Fusarium sp. NRRL 52700]